MATISAVFSTSFIGIPAPLYGRQSAITAVLGTGSLGGALTPRTTAVGTTPVYLVRNVATAVLGTPTARVLPVIRPTLSPMIATSRIGKLPGDPVYTAPPLAKQSPLFFIAEIAIQQPASATAAPNVEQGHGTHPWGTLADLADTPSSTSRLLASDAGYVTLSTDTGIAGSLTGVQSYPPVVSTGFQINRAVNLDPSGNGIAATWGTLSLINYNNQYDRMIDSYVCDGLPVTIKYGYKFLENWGGWQGTRASTASYIGPDKIMRLAAPNVARTDYYTGTAQTLLEPSGATNLITNDQSLPLKGGTNTIAVSVGEIPFLYETSPIFKSVYSNNQLMASKAPTVNSLAPGATVTGSMYVWVPVGINPASVYHVALETSGGNAPSIPVDLTKTGQWVRYASTYTNNTGSAVTYNINLRADVQKLASMADWGQQASIRTLNTAGTVAPDGTQTAVMIRDDATAASEHRCSPAAIPSNVQSTYTGSCYYKAGTRTVACWCMRASAAFVGGIAVITVDLLTGNYVICTQAGFAGATGGGVSYAGNGWWRIWVTGVTTLAFGQNISLSPNMGVGALAPANTTWTANAIYNGDNSSYLYAWGSQVDAGTAPLPYRGPYLQDTFFTTCYQIESGPTATSYIPTNGVVSGVRAPDLFVQSRGKMQDPPYASLTTALGGLATPWMLNDTTLDIPIRDATYWIERPYNSTVYGGTGGYDGTPNLAGTPKPVCRGTCYNITPVLIDPTNRIYQFSNAYAGFYHIYEGGAEVFSYAGDVADLYVGSTPAGAVRTCSARGMFQLGSVPVHQVTIDALGSFASAPGTQYNAVQTARYMLTEDMLIPPQYINISSFTAGDTAYPYPAGIYFDGSQTFSGIEAVGAMLENLAAKIIIDRSGKLTFNALRALPATALPVDSLDTDNIITLTPAALPNTLQPPVYRWRVGYQHNFTVQTSDLNTGSTTADHKQFISVPDRYAASSSNAVLTAYPRPNDHAPVGGGLVNKADAQKVADDLIALWAVNRRYYNIVVPVQVGVTLDIGQCVNVEFPAIAALATGKLGIIVGETWNGPDATIAFQVLV